MQCGKDKIMIEWVTPDIGLTEKYSASRTASRCVGSDTSAANLFLLKDKYGIKTASRGALLRYYNGSRPNRRGYGFPLYADDADQEELFALIRDDAASRGIPLEFCLCDERQKAALDSLCRIDWKCTDDDSDYIYNRESLALLAGKKLHRKRNHINNFRRVYDDISYRALDVSNSADALSAAEKWLTQRGAEASADERSEFESIKLALAHAGELGLLGGVLYVGDTPVAMTAASALSPAMVDVHIEKAYGEYAENGAFAVINQCFAAYLPTGIEYINREEDMGIEGLRTAKESYFPAFKLKKYYGVCKC